MGTSNPHAIRKHSVTIAGHRTSLSLEAAFWDRLRAIATVRRTSVNGLIREIDRIRVEGERPTNLSSAVRVFVLQTIEARPRGRGNHAAKSD